MSSPAAFEQTPKSLLEEKIEIAIRSPVLLVATDYDGTIADIVEDPEKAHPNREALIALRSLASLPQTHVAIISGRSLKALGDFTGNHAELHLVGSHGSEFDPGFASNLSDATVQLLRELTNEVDSIAKQDPGFLVEHKPASIAFHYRKAPPEKAEKALSQILEGPAKRDGVFLKKGKKVLELSVLEMSKGNALRRIRHRLGASAVIFFGDDITDEDAFRQLSGPDVGIKVGEGESLGLYRLENPLEVSRLLAFIAERRAEWLKGAAAVPIQEHSLLSDQRTIALVSPQARIVWLCLPRVDSNPIFAEIVGGPVAGYFAIEDGEGRQPLFQYYAGNSLQLISVFPGFRVLDYLDCSGGRTNQRAGRTDLFRVLEGEGKIRLEFSPRLDFGRIDSHLRIADDGLEVEDTPDPIVLRSPGVQWQIIKEQRHNLAKAEFSLKRGVPLVLELRFGTRSLSRTALVESKRREKTFQYWSRWCDDLQIPSVFPEEIVSLVRRSALTLKALCYGPTGAIAAAGTTSLPEHLGGVRNWDYRFGWLRDGALSAQALVRLGITAEAMQFLDWVLSIVDETQSPDRLRPLYTVLGENVSSEAELSELSGYAGSRPVRIGNSAAHQVQLDVFGPIVDLIWDLSEFGAPISSEHWRLVEAMVLAVVRRWKDPDHGIWEIRGPTRHHTHSKAMCWLTIDRAIKLADRILGKRRTDWESLRSEIRDEILASAWKESKKTFSAAYDGADLDASCLKIGLCGLLDPKDPRFISTVEAVEKELREGDTVYRYRSDDNLPGIEGGFHLCTTWLIEAYSLIGRHQDAETLFRAYLENFGKTGLISEEVDPKKKQALGNHPQAYSHLGLIFSAIQIFR